jgi:hypothetical protein
MNESAPIPTKGKIRKNLLLGIGLLSFYPFLRSMLSSKKKPVIACAPPREKEKTIKVLSRDGQLVEVDISMVKRIKGKISDEELQKWIKKQ